MANEQERKDSLINRIEIPAAKPSDEEDAIRALAEDFILSFVTAIKFTQLYPETNPAIQQSLERVKKKLLNFAAKENILSLTIKKRELIFKSKPLLPKKGDASKLALKFYLLDIQQISFNPRINEEDLRDFIYLIGHKVEDIKKEGSLLILLQKKNISNIDITLAKKVKVVKEKEGIDEDIEDVEELEHDDIEEIENKLKDFDNNINYFQDIFLSVSHIESRHRRMLLGFLENPSDFADLLVDISAQAVVSEGQTKLEAQVEFIQNAINNLGEYIQELHPFEQEKLFRKLAKVILSLKKELREDLLQQKMLPQLESGSLEAKILNYFPAIDLASALTTRLKLHSGASAIIYDALDNLTLPKERRNSIIELIRQKLTIEKKNMEEFDILFKDIDLSTRPSSDAKEPERVEFPDVSFEYGPQEESNIEDKVNEYKQLANKHEIIYTLLDLLPLIDNYQSFCVVVDKLEEKINLFVSEMQLDFLLRTVTVLKDEAEKRKTVSEKFARKIEHALEKLSSEETVYKMADIAIETEQDSEEFQKIHEITNTLGKTAVRNMLKRLIAEESMTARKKIIQLLIELGKDYIDILGANINHEKWYVVRNIVHILGHYGPEALPYLKKATHHYEFQVKKELVYALSRIKHRDSTQMLITFLLEDDDKRIHELVISQLGILSAKESIGYLLSFLDQKDYLQKNPSLILVIIKALGQIRAAEALGKLRTFTKARWILKRFWSPINWLIRRQAQIAIKLTESNLKGI
jgi:HEAT repeat protein